MTAGGNGTPASTRGKRISDTCAELAALRAAVTGLADEWETKHYTSPARARGSSPTLTFAGAACYLRALLTDEGDNDGR